MAGNKYANLIIIASVYWILSKCSVHSICFPNAVSVSRCPFLEWHVPHWMAKRAAPISSSFSCVCPPFTCLIIFRCLVAWISISTCCLFPICVDPWGPQCGHTFGTFLTLPSQHLFSALSVQFLTGPHTICQPPLSPRLLAVRAKTLVSLSQWMLCQPAVIQGGGCSVVGLPRDTVICTLEQLFNLRQLLVGVL